MAQEDGASRESKGEYVRRLHRGPDSGYVGGNVVMCTLGRVVGLASSLYSETETKQRTIRQHDCRPVATAQPPMIAMPVRLPSMNYGEGGPSVLLSTSTHL